MDEVHFPSNDLKVAVGQALALRGAVNNAFNTSMEVGVTVTTESLATGESATVCLAFFIFVALDAEGRKCRVEPVVPESFEEKHEFALAVERRKVRLKRKQLEQEVASKAPTHARLSHALSRGGSLLEGGGAEASPLSAGRKPRLQ